MTTKLFSELGLSAEVLKAIDKLGFEQASPIQAEAIPVLLQGRDVVGQSQTGSGKTIAFAVPALEKVDPHLRAVQVLMLCPTRELAVQVSEEVHKLALFKRGVHALPIYGGQSYERQFYGLQQGVQIVIGTPGRVMDHMRRGTLRLDKVRMVVLDEADVMLDMGFREDIEFILQAVPVERQTVFFCATLPRPIQDLIQRYAREPQSIRIEQKTLTVPTVEQFYYEVDRRFKIELLTRLIDIHDLKLGIIFCNTKAMVDDLVDHLNAQGYSADRLHGDMNQTMRDRVMNKFRKSGLEFLVATDVAARGIDVDDVQVVFNYDLPYDAEDYVHRIGRTGRAGRSGRAITFVSGREVFHIQQIERYTRMKIQRARVPTRGEVEEARASAILEKLRATLQSGEFKRQDYLIERLLEEGFSSTDIASALLHHLQGTEAAPAGKSVREESAPRPARAPFGDRPYDRGSERPSRAPRSVEERAARPKLVTPRPSPAPRAATVTRPAPAPVNPPASGARIEPPTAQAVASPPKGAVPTPSTASDTPASESPRPLPAAADTAALGDSRGGPLPEPEPKAEAGTPAAAPARPLPVPRLPDAGAKRPGRPAKQGFDASADRMRLHMNLGEAMGIAPGDVVGAILGETGLPAKVVGTVDIRERHLFVEVASEHTRAIIAKLNRTRIKGHKVKVKVA